MAGRIEGKVAVVTGGGAGIGRASCLRLAEEGARVVVTDISEERGRETVREIEGKGGEALFLRHDVAREDQWRSVVAEAGGRYGGVDVLLNNAGLYLIMPLADITVEDWNNLMAVNVTGVFLGMKHCAPVMAERGGGSIINLSSVAGLMGVAGHALYGASKGAVRIMTKDVAMEYARAQVRVNSVHPGYIHTGMAEYGAETAGTTIEELGRQMYPLGRIGEPEDVANTVLFLASDESKYTTGAEFVVDGGGSAGVVVGE
ncbi:glucose 1-dehydrogenase [Rubrobacter tropicus]|uniref:Glucose 1-dehydrogenase n=1 Tax=Rubrobacter tropicus TaxID=2653851 RepID=A0A6G8QDH0_9ACTN|nr:glucose 1-dehydrogenase [Rubrobacter tropicus]QIN84554.1 glucose 1-dehydrogenase [Rubrobacter tropicus]